MTERADLKQALGRLLGRPHRRSAATSASLGWTSTSSSSYAV
jgi:hypothetical protein